MRAPIARHVPPPADARAALEAGARLGFAARGLVYLIIGGFAFLAAAGRGGGPTGTHGALQTLLTQPFGKALLALVGLGLLAHAAWRLVMAARDPERRPGEGGAAALARRAGHAASGVANLGLAAFAGGLALPGVIPFSGNGDGNGARDWTAALMAQPLGRWLIALLGAVAIGAAAATAAGALRASFERHLDPAARRPAIRNLCRAGILARSVVLLLVGGFLLLAAWRADPSEARGLGATLEALQGQPFGPWLLGAIGLGLVAFGGYSFVACRWRRITTG